MKEQANQSDSSDNIFEYLNPLIKPSTCSDLYVNVHVLYFILFICVSDLRDCTEPCHLCHQTWNQSSGPA